MRYASNQTCQSKQGRHDLLTCEKDSLIICKLTSPRMARCHRWRQGENARYNLPLPLAQLHLRASVKSKAMRKRGFRQLGTALLAEPKIMGKTPVWCTCTPALYCSSAVTRFFPQTPRHRSPPYHSMCRLRIIFLGSRNLITGAPRPCSPTGYSL